MTIPAIRTNAELIAAIPVILGYAVTNNLIVVMLADRDGQRSIGCALSLPLSADVEQVVSIPEQAVAAVEQNDSAILIAISADPEMRDRATELLDAARDGLRNAGMPVICRLVATSAIDAGSWIDIDTFDTGDTFGYAGTVLAAETVFGGSPIATSRDEVVAEFAPAGAGRAPIDSDEVTTGGTVDDVREVLAGQRAPSDDLAARVAAVITDDVRLRDALLMAGIDDPGPSAAVWTRLASRMRGVARVQALSIAACHYYLNGDGLRAGIAIDVALADSADTGEQVPALTSLLDTALRAGFAPTQLREVFASASNAAKR
ncbi:MAG: DUF4192 domain-containing protein [Mycolicibacterium sp.]|uniref:DUF4192 domain-containing protein n=1 Tax=Mycolicibacterium sp. TaxID=2320850 RepID=UPI003D09C6C9